MLEESDGVCNGQGRAAMSPVSIPSDETLIAQIADRDRGALATLYERHGVALLRFIIYFTADRERAEEILQDTFVAVWRSAGSFAGAAKARTWLYGIARRQAHNTLRGKTLPVLDLAEAAEIASPDGDPLDVVVARADLTAILAALERLPVRLRAVLDLLLVEELSLAEIATVLDLPLGTVKSRLRLARAALRHLLEEAHDVR